MKRNFAIRMMLIISLVIPALSLAANASSSIWLSREVAIQLNAGNNAKITSVSCATAHFCVAGGYFELNNTFPEAFVSTYNGMGWHDQEITGSLNVGGYGGGYAVSASVNSVKCLTTTFCVAGGTFVNPGGGQAFVSEYNGKVWTDYELARLFNPGGNASVTSLDCSSPTSCVAGGYYEDNHQSRQAFVSKWDGAKWTDHEIASSLNLDLHGVAEVTTVNCDSTVFCVVGGFYTDALGEQQALVSIFNGKTWSDQTVGGLLNVGNYAEINSVDCASKIFCVAGGQYADANGAQQAFISKFNGKNWADHQIASLLNSNRASANSVSCATPSFCVVVGFYSDVGQHFSEVGPLRQDAFASVFNGSRWIDQELLGQLNLGGAARVSSVVCKSQLFCAMSGSFLDGAGTGHAIISFYNGRTWKSSNVADSFANTYWSNASSVSCVSNLFCASGGYYLPQGVIGYQAQAFVTSNSNF